MATSMSQRIVSSKVDFLMEQRNYLQTFVDETDKVLQMATSWLRNEDTTKSFTYSDMKKMVDDKLDFLVSTDFSVGCKEVTTEQESVAARSFPSAPKCTDQPLPAGHVHVSGVTVASEELKTILSQVNVMQEAMSSLSTSSKMFSEKQLAMEKLVESLSDKYSKVEQEKLREIERELAGIKEKHKKAVIQQDKRMTSFEKKIQAVTDTQSDIIENCHQQQIKIKDQKKETEKLKTQSQQFTKDLRDVHAATTTQVGALEGEIESLKESLEGLSTKFEEHGSSLEELSTRFEEHGSSLEELSTRFEEHGSSLEELSTRFEEHGSSLEALSTRFEEHGSSLEELSIRFEEHGSSLNEMTRRSSENLKVLTLAQERESEKLQELEEKLSALENSWSETTVENGKLFQDVETKYEMVCQIVTDRLVPLERLRNIFNGNLEARMEQNEKLDNVCDQMTDLLPKFVQVEQVTQRHAVGFSACLTFQEIESLRNKEAIIFDHVTFNHGDHYDSRTGEFTAPLDGLYAVYLSVDTYSINSYKSYFTIVKDHCLCGDLCGECVCGTVQLQSGMFQASTFDLIEINADETIFVKLISCSKINVTNIEISTFSCFKIF